MTHATTNSTLIRRHLVDLDRRSLSEGTTRRRRQVLERLSAHTDPRPLLATTREEIQTMLDRARTGPRTRYQTISHIHCFYEWAIREDLTVHDPTLKIIRPKLPRLMPRPISDIDLEHALKQAPSMMRAWLTLAAYAGFRCCEITAMDVSDILFSEKLLLVRGKGRVERLVPMHAKVAAELQSLHLPKSGAAFTRPRGSRYPEMMVSREISLYLGGVGVDATAHQLRHWFGTRSYQACLDLRAVQDLLGHATPTTTAIYTRFSPEAGRSAVDALT